ncbi:hydantoinase/oxoprolinase family protein [Mesorhizobium sp. IMUNJ 23232]|uniref:hydantoinase/oxoprolinase family protein n=1 Tax=Mesorhizobium sp. IMUNJ 23232 TaxID=3376064 RepID=UPI00379F9032
MPGVRIGVDIGGTFTDLVLIAENRPAVFLKVSSTPARPEEAVVSGVRAILAEAGYDPVDVSEVLHGTTVGSNTLLQKAGARCGLITTKGFRDVLEIGRVRTPGMFDLSWRKPEPLIRRRWRVEVDERTASDGTILMPLDPAQAIEAARFLVGEGIESIAICFLNSYANPANERAAAEAVAGAFPECSVSASVAVLPSMGEYERCSTVAVNAYVLPVLRGYIARLEDALAALGIRAPLLIGNSNGGLSTVALARSKPVFFISSGRSSGAVGAARLGASIGQGDLIAFDMGGTTASATLIAGGEVSRTHEYEFRDGISTPSRFIKAGGYLMRVPTVDVAEVGSGAGSIAVLDEGGLLRVGPVSAGAVPGPACYGLGGERPTVTDANVVLGLLPAALGGGALMLDVEAARQAIDTHIARPLGISVEAAAQGIRDVANTNMARAIRAVTVERGVDPRDFTLLAFGGSGPVHACDLAAMLGIRRILFPVAPGVFTAAGMLAGRLEHHFTRALPGRLDDLDPGVLHEAVEGLGRQAEDAFRADGYAGAALHHDFTVELRFQGQEAVVAVPLPAEVSAAALREDFLSRYKTIYGYASKDAIETAAVRLATSLAEGAVLDFAAMRSPDAGALAASSRRHAYFGSSLGWLDAVVMQRGAFAGAMRGPLILESRDSTVVIPPSASVEVDAAGNLIATLSAEDRA